ncbi:hypothetical protein ABZ770_05235 [Streptomyces sp. NPDC006654]|uniref:hypothetical protein n=1 Tax=Streptomyces sp. NPDC006654 TaxID=3156897 RepID=UPI0033E48FCA
MSAEHDGPERHEARPGGDGPDDTAPQVRPGDRHRNHARPTGPDTRIPDDTRAGAEGRDDRHRHDGNRHADRDDQDRGADRGDRARDEGRYDQDRRRGGGDQNRGDGRGGQNREDARAWDEGSDDQDRGADRGDRARDEGWGDRDGYGGRGEQGLDGRRGEPGEEGDALFAVLLDAPLTEAQRADPGFLDEYRAAAADVALLRAQLGIVGDALAGPPPAQVRARPAGRRRPLRHPGVRALGLAGALAAAFASVVFGIGWLAANGGSGAMSNGAAAGDKAAGTAPGPAGSPGHTTGPGYLACARLVVEGTVTAVHEIPHSGGERVTLRVTRAYKPAKTAEEVEFPLAPGTGTRIRPGVRLLVSVSAGQQAPDRYAVGEAQIAPERARILRDLPASRTLSCDRSR